MQTGKMTIKTLNWENLIVGLFSSHNSHGTTCVISNDKNDMNVTDQVWPQSGILGKFASLVYFDSTLIRT